MIHGSSKKETHYSQRFLLFRSNSSSSWPVKMTNLQRFFVFGFTALIIQSNFSDAVLLNFLNGVFNGLAQMLNPLQLSNQQNPNSWQIPVDENGVQKSIYAPQSPTNRQSFLDSHKVSTWPPFNYPTSGIQGAFSNLGHAGYNAGIVTAASIASVMQGYFLYFSMHYIYRQMRWMISICFC